jgi:hypothetical protein
MAYPYITREQLILRCGRRYADRVLDEDGDGRWDEEAEEPFTATKIDEIIADGCAKVAGCLRQHYDLDAVALNPPREVIRLSLDACYILLLKHFPEVFGMDWVEYDRALSRELNAIGAGKQRLDVMGPPEPAGNNGGEAVTGNAEVLEIPMPWANNYGDF